MKTLPPLPNTTNPEWDARTQPIDAVGAKKLQDEARSKLVDGRSRVTQFNPIAIDVSDPNASLQMKLDSKTYPGQMVRKEPNKSVLG
jgi:hypothetical protein